MSLKSGLQSSSTERPTEQPRVIGGLAAFALVAGSMLGIGIFLSPPVVARYVDSPVLFFAIWALAGLFALGGAVACGELGAMLPKAGGDYVFQREAFGPSTAFASGVVLFGAVFSGSIAAMAVGVATYQLPGLLDLDLSQPWWFLTEHFPITGAQSVALVLVLAFTALNSAGAKKSAIGQTLLTFLPIVALIGAAIWALASGVSPATNAEVPAAAEPTVTVYGIVLAYMAAYFAYSGWNSVIYVAGEVTKPTKNIPRAIVFGTLVVTCLYLLLCTSFMSVLGLDGLRIAPEAGTVMLTKLGGDWGGIALAVLVTFGIFASLNGSILGGARIAYAMAKDGALWPSIGKLSAHKAIPVRALWLQAAWACVLVLSGSFEQILHIVSLAMVLTGSLTVASLFVLRSRIPRAQRPYPALGYPWLPGLYLLSNALVLIALVVQALSQEPGSWRPLLGLGLLLGAFLVHRLWPGAQRSEQAI